MFSFFVSDNGSCSMVNDTAGTFPGNVGPCQGGKGTTYQGDLTVPFLVNWKGQIPEGTVSKANVMHTDILGSLLDAACIALPEMNGKNPVHGLSLVPHMISAGQKIPERTIIFGLVGSIGLRRGDHKLWAKLDSNCGDWDGLVDRSQPLFNRATSLQFGAIHAMGTSTGTRGAAPCICIAINA